MNEKSIRKLTWVDWTYLALVSGLMGYSIYLLYSLSQNESNGRLRVLRGVSSVCKSTASLVGKWGMQAETAYHRIIDAERMN